MAKKIEKFLGKIHQGDCIAGLKKVPDSAVDLVFADPPFNIGYKYDEYKDQLESEHYLEWSSQWMSQVHRVLKDDGAFWLAIGDDYAAELKIEAKKLGFHTRNWVVWYYTFGVHCKSKFTRSHTHLFYFVKNPKEFTFNFSGVAVPSARQLVYNDKRGNPSGRSPDDTWILRPQDCVDGFTTDEDTWYFPRVAGTFKERAGFHTCQMPEQLLGRIIRACSNEDELVIDPFSGSSTTLTVAKKLNRRYFGFELSKEYVKLGTERIACAEAGDALDGAEEPKVSAPGTGSKKRSSKASPKPRKKSAIPTAAPMLFEFDLPAETTGLVEAFSKSHRGFSVDRLIADPSLNEKFQSNCDKLSVPGSPSDRNRILFRIRKSGRLKSEGVETTKQTKIGWKEVDKYLDASEIAWKSVAESSQKSLDELFCDPAFANRFDQIAGQLSPGQPKLNYRWAALKLRKERSLCRKAADAHRYQDIADLLQKQRGVKSGKWDLEKIQPAPGVYLVSRSGKNNQNLYVGETLNLRERLAGIFSDDTKSCWLERADAKTLTLKVLPIEDYARRHFSRQFQLVKQLSPTWNLFDEVAQNKASSVA